MLKIVSFGYRFRQQEPEADMVFDCRRKMVNPFWVRDLRPYCGEDIRIINYLRQDEETMDFLNYVITRISERLEKKEDLSVAIGCTGGFHRSVFIAKQVYDHFQDRIPTTLEHLDIGKGGEA